MTLRELDDLIKSWDNRLRVAAQNLVDLRSLDTYQQLSGKTTVLSGETAIHVQPALDAMGTLFENFGRLQDVVSRAKELRANLGNFFVTDDRLHELEKLLRGRSIQLPALVVPIEQRSLLSVIENVQFISPDDLLNAMVRAFEAARDAVLSVEAAWLRLTTVFEEAGAEIARLQTLAHSPELPAIESRINGLRSRTASDPLGVMAEISSQILPVINSIRQSVDAVQKGFTTAEARLAELRVVHSESEACYAECEAKVTDCGPLLPPQPGGTIQGLGEWLETLRRKQAEGVLAPLSIGLRNWIAAADRCLSAERQAWAVNRVALGAREELRGRLDALKAKARAYGIAEDPGVAEAAREAAAMLSSRPTPIAEAARLVGLYEAALRGRNHKS